jgi:hypothetical protein
MTPQLLSRTRVWAPAALLALALVAPAPVSAQLWPRPAGDTWPQHSRTRPLPAPLSPSPQQLPVAAPKGAVILFDGSSLSEWETGDKKPAGWKLVAGAMEVAKGTGDIETKSTFGDVELHVEWMSPSPAEGSDQDRGNSGVFLMQRYEVQVLDSWKNTTYADGSAGSIYGQFPPRVNASRAPGEWQTYDIIFKRPRFDASGKVTTPAKLTVRHNGILVHEDVSLLGPTSNMRRDPYSMHESRLPIKLQDHGHPVRFRNIWLRDLEMTLNNKKPDAR